MKKEVITKYIAEDGAEFKRQDDCIKYEKKHKLGKKKYWIVSILSGESELIYVEWCNYYVL